MFKFISYFKPSSKYSKLFLFSPNLLELSFNDRFYKFIRYFNESPINFILYSLLPNSFYSNLNSKCFKFNNYCKASLRYLRF